MIQQTDTGPHVVPVDDLAAHTVEPDCWCKPTLDESGQRPVWVHHSVDMREEKEG